VAGDRVGDPRPAGLVKGATGSGTGRSSFVIPGVYGSIRRPRRRFLSPPSRGSESIPFGKYQFQASGRDRYAARGAA